jgi:hypothetical protein
VIDAEKKSGKIVGIKILSERGGNIQIENPFAQEGFRITGGEILERGEILKIKTSPGERIEIKEKD